MTSNEVIREITALKWRCSNNFSDSEKFADILHHVMAQQERIDYYEKQPD